MLSRQEEQLLRKETLDNDRRVREQGSTFLAHTHNDIGGRFAAISSPVVVGSESIPKYPAAYHQVDPVPDEPALGVSVEDHEPVGEPHELRASVQSLEPSPQGTSGDATAAPSNATSRLMSKRVASPSSSRSFRRF
jgi:hypothetical protein